MRIVSLFSLVVVVGLLASGCRLYGGYGSEEAALKQIEEANDRFANDLDRYRADYTALAGVSFSSEEMDELVEQFQETVKRHEALVRSHAANRISLNEGASYRTVSRVLGAVVSENDAVYGTYDRILAQLAEVDQPVHDMSRYQAVPPFYVNLERQIRRPSVRLVLAARDAR